MNIIETANKYRGLYIGTYVQIEAIMADITIKINKIDYQFYYKKTKSSDSIIKDFFASIDLVKNKLGKRFLDQIEFEKLMHDHRKHRNVFAHGLTITTQEEIDNFDGDKIKINNWAYGKSTIYAYSFLELIDMCSSLNFVLTQISQVQKDVYDFFSL